MEPSQKLLKILNLYKARGISFTEAQNVLLEQGFDEEEIFTVASSISYGTDYTISSGSPSLDSNETNLQATRASNEILLSDLKRRRRYAVGLDKDSMIALLDSRSRHGSLDMIGLPLGRLVIVGVFITVILYGLSIPKAILPDYSVKLFLVLYVFSTAGFLTYRMVKLNQTITRLEKATSVTSKIRVQTILSYGSLALLLFIIISFF